MKHQTSRVTISERGDQTPLDQTTGASTPRYRRFEPRWRAGPFDDTTFDTNFLADALPAGPALEAGFEVTSTRAIACLRILETFPRSSGPRDTAPRGELTAFGGVAAPPFGGLV